LLKSEKGNERKKLKRKKEEKKEVTIGKVRGKTLEKKRLYGGLLQRGTKGAGCQVAVTGCKLNGHLYFGRQKKETQN